MGQKTGNEVPRNGSVMKMSCVFQFVMGLLSFVIAMMATLSAPAQTPRVETRDAQVKLYAPLRFVNVYKAFIEGVHPDVFDSCARFGARCPGHPRLFSSWADAPERLREFPHLECNRLGDTPSPAEVAASLFQQDVLTARCLHSTTAADNTISYAWTEVRLSPHAMGRHAWHPHRWFPRDCTQIALTVAGKRSFTYLMRVTQAMQSLNDAATALQGPVRNESVLREAATRARASLHDPDRGTSQAALLFARAFVDEFLHLTQAPPVPPPERTRTRIIVRTEPNTSLQVFGILSATIACVFILLFVLARFQIGQMQKDHATKNEELESLRMSELARAETTAMEKGRREGREEAERGFNAIKQAALALAERLLNLLPEGDSMRAIPDARDGDKDVLVELRSATANFSKIFQDARNLARAQERDIITKRDAALKAALIEALQKLGLEVQNPTADLVTLVTTTFEKWRNTRTAQAVPPHPTVSYASGSAPGFNRPTATNLLELARAVVREVTPNAAKSLTSNETLALAALKAFAVLCERQAMREEQWGKWKQRVASLVNNWLATAEAAQLKGAVTSADQAPDLAQKAKNLTKVLESMQRELAEVRCLCNFLDTLLPSDSVVRGLHVSLAVKIGAVLQLNTDKRDAALSELLTLGPAFSTPSSIPAN